MKEYDKVIVPDGRVGHIIEFFENGDCLVEFETPDGPHRYDDEFFMAEDVKPLGEASDFQSKRNCSKTRYMDDSYCIQLDY